MDYSTRSPKKAIAMSWALHAKDKLKKGENAVITPHGNSMHPRIESGATVELAPITDKTEVRIGDVVLVHVGGKDYLHLVKAMRGNQFQIGNNKGHINGWVTLNSIYGVAINIEN